ncbi:hypothetical protein ACXX82_02525 [Glaciimonas sp. GNP009]
MKSKINFELCRWLRHVILFFLGTAVGILIVELVAAPLLVWLLYDIPYQLPTWNRIGRWSLGILFIGFFAGSLSWFYEKRSSGR